MKEKFAHYNLELEEVLKEAKKLAEEGAIAQENFYGGKMS
jgi:hypothetical protein